jgi:SagB-type dehydrogenase family enzyme
MVDAREYHERTIHTIESVREGNFTLDRSTKPRTYKIYEDLPHLSSTRTDPPERPALAAIDESTPDPTITGDSKSIIDKSFLHTLCHYATGVTKTIEIGGQEMPFRAASCTGRLYHIDLYAVCGGGEGIDAGIYHFDPHTDGFDVLREGDYRGVLARAAGDRIADTGANTSIDADGQNTGIADAPVTIIATSTWWRNAWKYRNRAYRHAFWDSGTILANLLGVAHALGQRAQVVTGFADDPAVRLLGLESDEEAPLELIPVGQGDSIPSAPTIEAIDPAEVPLSGSRTEYPLVPDAWQQSTLADGEAARTWREQVRTQPPRTHSTGDGEQIALDPVDAETASGRPIANTIERRGSLREYSHEPITARTFATVLDRALSSVPIDCWGQRTNRVVEPYCLIHAVEDVPSGAYQYHPEENVLERVGDTDRKTAGHLALDQPVVGDAAVNVYLMADVDALVDRVGNRGYRLAQLEGGIMLGRLYLATYAHRRLGGRGFTFYDERVTEYLSPQAADQTPMTLFAFGKADKSTP